MFNYLLILINKRELINGISVKPCAIWNFNKIHFHKRCKQSAKCHWGNLSKEQHELPKKSYSRWSIMTLDNDTKVIKHSIVFNNWSYKKF